MTDIYSSDTIEAIRDAWELLRPSIHRYIKTHPAYSPDRSEKALVEEMIKFDCIVNGNLRVLVALFRETIDEERAAHADTKVTLKDTKETLEGVRVILDGVRAELSDVYVRQDIHLFPRSMTLEEPPSPIHGDSIHEWGGESSD